MIVWAVVVWLASFGFYLFLAGDVSAVEIAAGVICATVGTTLAVGLSRVARRSFAGIPPIRSIVAPVSTLFPETFVVGRELVAAILSRVDQRGAFVRQPFEPGANNDRETSTRRALTVLGVSLAPRSFVIRGEASDTMLLHALPEKAASPDTRWPL